MAEDVLETETLAWVYLEQGHPERAAEIFGRLLAANQDNRSAARGLASCREKLRSRGKEVDMAHDKKLIVLQQMLARLTGAPAPQQPAPRQDLASGVAASAAASKDDPRQKKLQLLKSMLDRLGN